MRNRHNYPFFSTKLKMKLSRVFWIGAIWGLVGFLDPIFIWCMSQSPVLKPTPAYDFKFDLIFTPIAYLVGGWIAGIVLVFVLRGRWRTRPFYINLFWSTFIIGGLHFFLSTVAYTCIFANSMDQSVLSPEVWGTAVSYLSEPPHLKNTIFIMLLVMATVMFLRVNDRYGPGNLLASFLGKYHRPLEEERIFMFLDLRSSTSIAEQLGHIRFHEFLDDFFRDISDPVLYSRGEIYQYVGDEAIVTWKLEEGLENANCITCFFEIVETISRLSSFYEKKYDGIVPEFKAGLHIGKVTTGEIGELKRELVHSGDVMNTTARIQAKCNDVSVNILVSNDLLQRLRLVPARFAQQKIGHKTLRGKQESIELYTFVQRP